MSAHRGATFGIGGERAQQRGQVAQAREGVAHAEQLQLRPRFELEPRGDLEGQQLGLVGEGRRLLGTIGQHGECGEQAREVAPDVGRDGACLYGIPVLVGELLYPGQPVEAGGWEPIEQRKPPLAYGDDVRAAVGKILRAPDLGHTTDIARLWCRVSTRCLGGIGDAEPPVARQRIGEQLTIAGLEDVKGLQGAREQDQRERKNGQLTEHGGNVSGPGMSGMLAPVARPELTPGLERLGYGMRWDAFTRRLTSGLAAILAVACSAPSGPSPEDQFRALGYWSGTCDENAPFVLRCGIIAHVGNSYVRGQNNGESGPINLDSAVLNQKYVRWGFYLKPQRVQAKLCYFHPAVSDWLCNWIWGTYTATDLIPDSVDAGTYTADQGDWAVIFTFLWAGDHRVVFHAESNGAAPIEDTVQVHIASDSAPPPPPPPLPLSLAGRSAPVSQLVVNGRVISELRLVPTQSLRP